MKDKHKLKKPVEYLDSDDKYYTIPNSASNSNPISLPNNARHTMSKAAYDKLMEDFKDLIMNSEKIDDD